MYELRITLLSAILLFVLSNVQVRAEPLPQVLKDYKPLSRIMMCEDTGTPCIVMLQKETPLFYAVFSPEGKLLAITRMLNGKEETIWGKLPPKPNEKEI